MPRFQWTRIPQACQWQMGLPPCHQVPFICLKCVLLPTHQGSWVPGLCSGSVPTVTSSLKNATSKTLAVLVDSTSPRTLVTPTCSTSKGRIYLVQGRKITLFVPHICWRLWASQNTINLFYSLSLKGLGWGDCHVSQVLMRSAGWRNDSKETSLSRVSRAFLETV